MSEERAKAHTATSPAAVRQRNSHSESELSSNLFRSPQSQRRKQARKPSSPLQAHSVVSQHSPHNQHQLSQHASPRGATSNENSGKGSKRKGQQRNRGTPAYALDNNDDDDDDDDDENDISLGDAHREQRSLRKHGQQHHGRGREVAAAARHSNTFKAISASSPGDALDTSTTSSLDRSALGDLSTRSVPLLWSTDSARRGGLDDSTNGSRSPSAVRTQQHQRNLTRDPSKSVDDDDEMYVLCALCVLCCVL